MLVEKIMFPVVHGRPFKFPFAKGKRNIKYIKSSGLCSVNFGFKELEFEGKEILNIDIEAQDFILTNMSNGIISVEIQYEDIN